jgi:hypothetical protein
VTVRWSAGLGVAAIVCGSLVVMRTMVVGDASRKQARAQTLVIANGSIIDPAGSDPVTLGSVVVVGDRITAVGPAIPVPPGARVVDGRGKFLVPGLWDMHAHLAATTPIGRAPEHYVSYGILGVRDMGGFPDSLFPLRDAIRSGARIGPDLMLAGPTLNGEQFAPFHRKVVTDSEARIAVHQLAAAGVDFIKVHRATGRTAFLAILDEARSLGRDVARQRPDRARRARVIPQCRCESPERHPEPPGVVRSRAARPADRGRRIGGAPAC